MNQLEQFREAVEQEFAKERDARRKARNKRKAAKRKIKEAK